MRDSAARRLGVLALLVAVIASTFFFIFARQAKRLQDTAAYPLAITGVCLLIAGSLVIFALTRRRSSEPGFVLTLGLAYQVIVGLNIGILSHIPPSEAMSRVRGWSGVAVWLILFTIMVPSSPARALFASLLTALMDPLGMVITMFLLGNPAPPAALLPKLFVPTFMAVVVAVVSSRISFRLGRDLGAAREMGSYQLVEELGRGGMGEVWRAEHKSLVRPAAIKLIRADRLAADEESATTALKRFEREAQATASMECEHTIRVYDFGTTTDGSFYYVMELLDGIELERLVKRFGPVPVDRVIFLLLQACESLAEAHHNNLIHRDIKPANILTCRSGLKHDFIKVLDFGLVTHTSATSSTATEEDFVAGTPAYMAPETLEKSGKVDARADLYSLGCVAFWLLAGRHVYIEDTPLKTALAHLRSSPVPLSALTDIPRDLEQVVNACLEKDPAKRPQTATELAERLGAVELAEPWNLKRAEAWWAAHQEEIAFIDSGDATETVPGTKTTVVEGRWA